VDQHASCTVPLFILGRNADVSRVLLRVAHCLAGSPSISKRASPRHSPHPIIQTRPGIRASSGRLRSLWVRLHRRPEPAPRALFRIVPKPHVCVLCENAPSHHCSCAPIFPYSCAHGWANCRHASIDVRHCIDVPRPSPWRAIWIESYATSVASEGGEAVPCPPYQTPRLYFSTT
jgi:hypothetical protein